MLGIPAPPLAIAVLVPFVAAIAVASTGARPRWRDGILVVAGIVHCAVLFILLPTLSLHTPVVEVVLRTLPTLLLAFHLEPLGLLFALTAGVLWPLTSLYAIGYLAVGRDGKEGDGGDESQRTRFHALFCVAIGSATGIAFAENLFTLFLFYEILTFSTWPLVTHSRTPAAIAAGRVYLGLLLGTSLLLFLLAIVLIGNYGDSLSFVRGGVLAGRSPLFVTCLLLLFLFGIGKAALMPVHRWLPNAMVAPAPVSALLHAVAVVKAGVFCILKISVYIFGFDTLSALASREVLLWLPATTILIASLIAMRQDELKARLAYSTISQLSCVILGALLANSAALVGSGLHITLHAFGKITLFFCAGSIMLVAGKKYVSQMAGLGRTMPWTFAAFFLAALSMAGIPPAGGMWSKWYLALGVLESGQIALLAVLLGSTLLNVYYLLSIPLRAFFLPAPIAASARALPPSRERHLLLILPPMVTAVASILLFFLASGIADRLYALTQQ